MYETEIEEKIKIIFSEVVKGKINTAEGLDKRLSSSLLMRIPLAEWKEAQKNELSENRAIRSNLENRRESFYLFIIGLVIGFIVSLIIGGLSFIPIIFLATSTTIIGIITVVMVYFILKINKKIKTTDFLLEEWYPYAIVRKQRKLADY